MFSSKGELVMVGWLFGGFVKKLERAVKNVSQDFVKDSGREIERLIEKELNPLVDKLDYVAKKRIKQSIREVENLEGKTKSDIEALLNNANNKTKYILDDINKIRQEAIADLRETIGQTDACLENRINQISLVVMNALNLAQEITEDFTPENIHNKLVQPTLVEITALEDKLFQDADYLLDKLENIIDKTLEQIRAELKKYLVHTLPGPFDRCRQQLKIAWKPGAMFTDLELYELNQCYELSKLNENVSIDSVLKIYGQLQLNSERMIALVKNVPELRRRAVRDWIEYGVLCEFWQNTMKSYDSMAPILESQNSQEHLALPESHQNS